ncbi:hypothetical protein COCVIDRAFT_109659 [Bipolaris victoriae FI3]|uniref:Uncharacterized protein n=1 Tax=Bipolaris victoriae (strain FI3) TaxID=930091 RepID=W7EFY0_BIPV3|nr:hypothetical protein COCVIDRAFT_109659 [Bipolaris victoriae FI3]
MSWHHVASTWHAIGLTATPCSLAHGWKTDRPPLCSIDCFSIRHTFLPLGQTK